MSKDRKNILNFVLAVLVVAAVICSLIFAALSSYSDVFYKIIPLPMMILGLFCIYVCIKFGTTAFKLFLGIDFTASGLMALLITNTLIPISFARAWPLFTILTGISLFSAGCRSSHKLLLRYNLPSFVMVVSGLLFMPFSLKLLSISFNQFVLFSAPVIVFTSLFFLVFLMVKRKALLSFLPEEISKNLDREAKDEEDSSINGGDTFIEDNSV